MIEFRRINTDLMEYTCSDGLWRLQCVAPAVVALVEDDGTWCGQASCANEAHLAEAIELHEARKADEWAWYQFGPWVVA